MTSSSNTRLFDASKLHLYLRNCLCPSLIFQEAALLFGDIREPSTTNCCLFQIAFGCLTVSVPATTAAAQILDRDDSALQYRRCAQGVVCLSCCLAIPAAAYARHLTALRIHLADEGLCPFCLAAVAWPCSMQQNVDRMHSHRTQVQHILHPLKM